MRFLWKVCKVTIDYLKTVSYEPGKVAQLEKGNDFSGSDCRTPTMGDFSVIVEMGNLLYHIVDHYYINGHEYLTNMNVCEAGCYSFTQKVLWIKFYNLDYHIGWFLS